MYNFSQFNFFINFLQKTTNDCFFLYQETCVFTTVTSSKCCQNWFIDSARLNKGITDFIICNLKDDFTNEVHLCINGSYSYKLNFKSQLRNVKTGFIAFIEEFDSRNN